MRYYLKQKGQLFACKSNSLLRTFSLKRTHLLTCKHPFLILILWFFMRVFGFNSFMIFSQFQNFVDFHISFVSFLRFQYSKCRLYFQINNLLFFSLNVRWRYSQKQYCIVITNEYNIKLFICLLFDFL